MNDNMPVIQTESAPVVVRSQQLSVAEIVSRLKLKQEVYNDVMIKDTHYGVIPGCPKPSLYKPGAEVLGVTYGLSAEYSAARIDTFENGHREVTTTCRIKNEAGRVIAECTGSCSTLEKKYRWRDGQRKCLKCGAEAIIASTDFKSKEKNGWLCFIKRGGCGAKYPLGDKAIESQKLGQIENPDVADQYNTVLKMAQKRAYVGAMLTATAASDIFTQDVEDMPEFAKPEQAARVVEVVEPQKPAPQPAAKPAPAAPKQSLLEAIKAGSAYEYDLDLARLKFTTDEQKKSVVDAIRAAKGEVSADKSRAYSLTTIEVLHPFLMNDPATDMAPMDDPMPAWGGEGEVMTEEETQAKFAELKAKQAKKGAK